MAWWLCGCVVRVLTPFYPVVNWTISTANSQPLGFSTCDPCTEPTDCWNTGYLILKVRNLNSSVREKLATFEKTQRKSRKSVGESAHNALVCREAKCTTNRHHTHNLSGDLQSQTVWGHSDGDFTAKPKLSFSNLKFVKKCLWVGVGGVVLTALYIAVKRAVSTASTQPAAFSPMTPALPSDS